MAVYTKPGAQVFAPQNNAGNARPVSNGDAQVWATEVERSITASAEGLLQAATWALFSNIEGVKDGQPGRVTGPDGGTHSGYEVTEGGDIELNAGVQNTGEYFWRESPAGWVRTGGTSIVQLEADISNEIEARRGLIEGKESGGDDPIFTVVDSQNRRTWIEADAQRGGPTDHARDHIARKLAEVISVPEIINATGYSFVVATPSNLLTDLALDDKGQFAEFVIARLAERIRGYLEGYAANDTFQIRPAALGSDTVIRGNDLYSRDGELLPVLPDMTKIVGWGSSTMEGMGSRLVTLATSYGATYYNQGKSSERMRDTCARLGSHKALLRFPGDEIPASGAVDVVSPNLPPRAALKPFDGIVGGVEGTLSATAGTLTFTRASAGDAVAVEKDVPFIPLLGAEHRSAVTLLNLGKNSLTGETQAGEMVARMTHEAFDYLSPFIKRILVIGQFKNTGTIPGSDVANAIDYVNASLMERFGHLFVDLGGYVTSSQVWVDTGITPTTDDLDAQGLGTLPPSIASNAGHFNNDGYTAVVNNLVKGRIDDLGWYE